MPNTIDITEVETLNGRLMASCVRNTHAKKLLKFDNSF